MLFSLSRAFTLKQPQYIVSITNMQPITNTTTDIANTPKVQQIITKACSEVTFPMKVTELLTFYQKFSSKIPQNTNTFDTLFTLNYEAAQKEMAEFRHKLLQQFKDIITDDISIQRCLKKITPENFKGKISQQFIGTLESYYQFASDYEDRGQQISECFDDLLLLMMKLSQEYMKGFQLMETWKNNLEDEMEVIKDELRAYLAECFYSFKKEIKKKVKKMLNNTKYQPTSEQKVDMIKKSYNDYKKNLLRQLKVSKWLLPQNILQKNLEMQEWNIRNQIGRLLHNKHDFVLVTKKKISEVFQQTKKVQNVQFDFLNETQKKCLIDVMSYCLAQEKNISKQSQEQLRFMMLSLQNMGFKYQWNKIFMLRTIKPLWDCSSQQANMKTMINLYILYSENYTTAKRNFLKSIFRLLNNFKYGYSNFKVLLNLENRNLPVTNKILKQLRNENVQGANQEIRTYLNQFLIQNDIKIKQKLPYFHLEKISDPSSNSRVITICISGFISQTDVPNQSWRKLIGNTEGEIYSLGWESKTLQSITSFAWAQLERLVASQSFFTHPVFTIAGIAKTLVDSYRNNPFFQAFDHAVFCGQLLGRLIMQIFPGYLINLISFSLGTQLVKQTIKIMKVDGKLNMINQVILIGGCADKAELQTVLDKTHLNVINCYTKQDSILKWLFKSCKPFASPIGRYAVNGVQNIDCSKFVSGHTKYRECMDELRKRIELDDDSYYATQI